MLVLNHNGIIIYTMVTMEFIVFIDVKVDSVSAGEPVTDNYRKKPGCLPVQAGSLACYFFREAISITNR